MAYHYYTTKIREQLPHGRWLNGKDEVRPTDLVCWNDRKAQTVRSAMRRFGKINIVDVSSYLPKVSSYLPKFFYRPITPRYRILGLEEVIKKGDELADNRPESSVFDTWNPVWGSIGSKVKEWHTFQFRRRIHRAS